MKPRNNYLKIVEWSEEDRCYIGRIPGLVLGGVHGDDETEVYAELCELAEEWIKIYEEDGVPLPPPTAARDYSGKFNLRVGQELHQRLVLEALKADESLNGFCVAVLKRELGV